MVSSLLVEAVAAVAVTAVAAVGDDDRFEPELE